jgi:gamma-glutamyl-gamma-aminobutyraldehyde dehydrogenase/4-guanidinobutyraldehyde dehydrogenase/NAD-dependent aldehyde dehydrogenase
VLTREYLRPADVIGDFRLHTQAFIDGSYTDAVSGETFECVSPCDGSILAHVTSCDVEDVDRAVAAARRAFETGVWAQRPPRERKEVLLRFAELIDEHLEELALLETIDMGKPIANARGSDVPGAARCIRYYGEALDKIYDEIAPTARTDLVLLRREPVGVVGAIVPWNFPLLMASWKLGPALAAGNSVILKPAEQSPLSAIRLAELGAAAGLPDGVLQVLPGFGPTAGRAIGMHMDVDMLAFTGSTEVGKLLLQYAGLSNMKRTSLECGGKSPHIIMRDCSDLDGAAEAAAWGIFYNQGEVCNAGSRLLVDQAIAPEFIERVVAASEAIVPANPLDPSTQMGAMVDRDQQERVLTYIDTGVREGATVRLGGHATNEDLGGYYIEPTIFTDVDNRMAIAQEEIFGPVLATIPFSSVSDAITIANDSVYGLAAAVWSDNVNVAHRVARDLRAGVVWVNTFDSGDMSSPFGGFKQSGYGRDKSVHALEKYTDWKAIWLRLREDVSNDERSTTP